MLRTIPILLYHKIADMHGATPPHLFFEHMAFLQSRGVKALTLNEFEIAIQGRELPCEKTVLITFDDGSRTCLTEAYPVLDQFQYFATAFVITGRMVSCMNDVSPEWEDTLTWQQARSLNESGLFAIQSHTHTHVKWGSDQQEIDRLADELVSSRNVLMEEIGGIKEDYCHLAWPWGRCSLQFETLASSLGYRYQYLVQRASVIRSGDTLRLPRICCDGMSLGAFKRSINMLLNPLAAAGVTKLSGTYRRAGGRLSYV